MKSPTIRAFAFHVAITAVLLRERFAELCTTGTALLARAFPGSQAFAHPNLAINDGGPAEVEEEITFGSAVNVAPIDEAQDDWIDISPYGEFPNEQGTQIVDHEAAETMVAAHNSFLGKLGRMFRGIPVYRGHPYQRPDIWPDDTRYGRVNELRAGDRALQGKVAWNDIGQRNKEQGYWVYPSPGWIFKRLGDGKIKPVRLDHIGLTNNPNISESVPVTNSRTATMAREQQQHKENMNKEALIKALGLKAEATDAEILTAINSLQDNAALATNAEKNPLIIELNGKLNTAIEANKVAVENGKKNLETAINVRLDFALEKGVINAAERETLAKKFATDYAGLDAELKEKKPAINTKGLNLSPSGKDLSDASKRRIAFNARLDELMKPDRDGKTLTIDQAINSMRSNDEDRALLDAMQVAVAA